MGEGNLEGKRVIVTGAGRGIGREEALAARGGGRVGRRERPGERGGPVKAATGGRPRPSSPRSWRPGKRGRQLRRRHRPRRGRASRAAGRRHFGDLDILVNNAGILRDGMVFSIDPQEWQSVVNVHLMGHFLPTRAATVYWRERAKPRRLRPHRTIVNTSSESGLFGNAAPVELRRRQARHRQLHHRGGEGDREVQRHVQCHRARARTRLTTTTFDGSSREGEFGEVAAEVFDAMDPANIAPFVAYLATDERATSRARRSSCTAASWNGCGCPTSTCTS